MGDISVEMNTFTGPQEIIVAGVGESPPNFEASWVKREVLQKGVARSPCPQPRYRNCRSGWLWQILAGSLGLC